VTALDGTTGAIRWNSTPKPIVAGVTPTAGGLVFTGDRAAISMRWTRRVAKVLKTIATVVGRGWSGHLHGRWQQYVATTSGNVSRSAWPMAMGAPRLIVMSLDVPERKTHRVALPRSPPRLAIDPTSVRGVD